MRGDGLRNRLAIWLARRRCRGLSIGAGVKLDSSARIRTHGNERVTIAGGSVVEPGVVLYSHDGEVQVGQRTLLGPHCVLLGAGGITIGDDVLIGPHCVLAAGNHRFGQVDRTIREQGDSLRGICVESDVWIGAHVVILDGVTVGTGSVLAAGAVVDRDVPPYAVVAGVPARTIADRSTPARGGD